MPNLETRDKAADVVVIMKELATDWEACEEVGMIHCDCVMDAAVIREMAARLAEICGMHNGL